MVRLQEDDGRSAQYASAETTGCNSEAVTWKTNVISPTCVKLRRYRSLNTGYNAGRSDCMVIAPLNQLWVMVNVYERDQSKVAMGQRMNIQFPFLQKTASGAVEYVASEVSKDSRAVQVRASIPNPDGSLKADMLVRAVLDVPPIAGQTVVPRLSMVVINGDDYVFVRNPADGAEEKEKRFERRKVTVAQENSDFVIVHNGLAAGEEVVTNGSLILAQLYEDLQMVNTGAPPL